MYIFSRPGSCATLLYFICYLWTQRWTVFTVNIFWCYLAFAATSASESCLLCSLRELQSQLLSYLQRWCHASSLYMHNTHMHGLMSSFSSKDAEIYLVHLYKGPEHVPHWSTIQSMPSSNIMECDLSFLMNLIVWSNFLLSLAVDLWLLPISHSNSSQFSSDFSAVFTFNVSIRTSK